MNRRTFLKIAGMGSVSLAAGCNSKPEKNLYALVQAPENMVTGTAAWYASTCRECPAGCGVLAKNREGRVIKLEGNPAHPINAGKLCMRGQAALQGVYNPDRITTPLLREKDRWMPLGFAEAESLLREKAADDIVVCGGGIMPDDDIKKLKESGVKEIITPGTPLDDIVKWVKNNVTPR